MKFAMNTPRYHLFLFVGLVLTGSCNKDEKGNINGSLADWLVENSGEQIQNWNSDQGYSFELKIQISNAEALEQFLSSPAQLKIPYTTWETGDAETKILDKDALLSIVGNQFILHSTVPITVGTIATLTSANTQETNDLILSDWVKTGQLIEQDKTVRLSNKPFIINNPNGYYKEVIASAPADRLTVIPYSNLSVATPQEAENIIRDILQNRIGLSEQRTNLFISKLNSPEFNDATENNYQLKSIALAMAAVDATDFTFDALVGNVQPRIYVTLTDPSQGAAEVKVVTVGGQQAYKIFFSILYFSTIDPLAALPVAFGNERLEMGNLVTQSSKREQIAQAIIMDYLWLKTLNKLTLSDAKLLFEQTNPQNKVYNMNLASQSGSSNSLSKRLPNAYKTQITGNLTAPYPDTSYIARIRRAYGSYSDNISTTVEEPMKQFIINELGANINQFPTVYNDEFIDKLQNTIDIKNSIDKRWNRFYQLAKLDPNLY